MSFRWWVYPLILLGSLILVGAGILALVLVLIYPNLPSIDAVTDYRPKLPLRVYTADGDLMGEFGEEKRAFVKVGDFPPVMKNAIIAAEDERFYEHSGVDFIGLARAATGLVTQGKMKGGGSILERKSAISLQQKLPCWQVFPKRLHSTTPSIT